MNKLGSSTLLSRKFDRLPFIYGTAWKNDETTRLVKEALGSGFRAIDTACQPRHYRGELVGKAIQEALNDTGLSRQDIWIQTKYTSPAGQDHKTTPYNRGAEIETQVHTSIATSLRNLHISSESDSNESNYLDCVLLHSPLKTPDDTIRISNVSLPILSALYDAASVKPHIVQNRFYPSTHYDVDLRAYCREKGVVYQSFWTLTGNPKILGGPIIAELAESAQVTPQVALYALVTTLDVVVLNGTTSSERMQEDLEGMEKVREWAHGHANEAEQISKGFQKLIKEP
ncbi:aldo-keto reductase-like protein [Tothia fuscella]|uniref:Aldo-keto reductase-like protein n=1 Tax=Tothia fuscella TaxID=1048955 RepID=A0A9P4NPR1_9PEZI|nr:aldo-keto reductase-like protein [Tothia fuscella]